MIIDGINRLIGTYYEALKNIWRASVFLPFFILFIIQFVLLISLKNYVNPYIYPILSSPISLMGDYRAEFMTHYPGLYIFLPLVFQYAKLAIGILFEGLISGMTIIAFLKIYAPSKYSDIRLSSAFGQWHNLLLCWLVISALLYLINNFIPPYFSELLIGSPRRQAVFELGMGFLTAGFYAIFIYAVPSVIIFKKNFISAIMKSFGYFARFPIFSISMAMIAFLITLPASFISARSGVIVEKFTPELVFYVLLFGIVSDLIINILLTGALVKFISDDID